MISLLETCQQYVARRLSEGWKIISRDGFNVVLQSPDGIIRLVDLRNDVETLRPNAVGDEETLMSQGIGGADNWEAVDEIGPDDETTYVRNENTPWKRDLYNLPASSGSGTINFIKIYIRLKGQSNNGGGKYAKPSMKSNTTVTDGGEITLTAIWAPYSEQWNTNPADGAAWEWVDIDALQIGVSLKVDISPDWAGCTQVYVEVDYTPGGVDVTITSPLITSDSDGKVPTMSLGLSLSPPLVAPSSEGLVPSFALDKILQPPRIRIGPEIVE